MPKLDDTARPPMPPEELKVEVEVWARRIGVLPQSVHVRPMKRKWASCSSKGRVTFADDLLAQPDSVRREVIVHELLHLKVPNHGRLFRSLLKAYLGDASTPPRTDCECERI
jgi:predicted metal-dependent hydrolase